MNIKTISESAEIIQNNLDYTLFSWSKQKDISPIAVKYAAGVYLYDYDDKKYIDFLKKNLTLEFEYINVTIK